MTDEPYRATLAHLFRLRRFGSRPGLEVIRGLLSALGHPEERFPSIHVAGSKGKGSVAALSAAILSANHCKTGLFTSPHLRSYRERMQVDGRPIDPQEVTERVGRVRDLVEALEHDGGIPRPATFFEVTTAVAFDWFASEKVDAAVVEVGLGGRLDATNVLRAPVGVVTTIASSAPATALRKPCSIPAGQSMRMTSNSRARRAVTARIWSSETDSFSFVCEAGNRKRPSTRLSRMSAWRGWQRSSIKSMRS